MVTESGYEHTSLYAREVSNKSENRFLLHPYGFAAAQLTRR